MTNTAAAIDRTRLLAEVRANFKLEWGGHHGANHWARVRYHGLALARARGGDLVVVELFAFLHDSQRHDEYRDPRHGERGAEYSRSLQGRYFDLQAKQLQQLTQAIRGHSDGGLSNDATIQSCWDADRLDLGRVGIKPDVGYLSFEAARHLETAYAWSRGRAKRKGVRA